MSIKSIKQGREGSFVLLRLPALSTHGRFEVAVAVASMDYPDYFSKVVSSNQVVIIMQQGADSKLAKAVGNDMKGELSMALYAIAIPSAFVHQWVADAIYIFVALVWLIPDRRIESKLSDLKASGSEIGLMVVLKLLLEGLICLGIRRDFKLPVAYAHASIE